MYGDDKTNIKLTPPVQSDEQQFTVPEWWPETGTHAAGKSPTKRQYKRRIFVTHIADQIAAGRFIVLLAASYAAGIIVFFQAGQNPNLPISLFLASAAGIITLLVRNSYRFAHLCLLVAALAVGFAVPQVKVYFVGTPMLAAEINLPLTGKVAAITISSSGRKTLFLSNLSTRYKMSEPLPRIARLTMLKTEPLQFSVGDTISLFARLSPVPKPVLPDSYDSQIQSFFKGIGAFGLVFGSAKIEQLAERRTIAIRIAELRTSIAATISQSLPGDSGAVATAMLVGNQSGITDEIRKKMQVSGLAHILAISGLHMTLVAGGVYFVLRLLFATSHTLTLSLNTRMLAASLAIPAAFSYLAISGAGIATLRATIMATIVFIAILSGRRALTMRNVAIAAIIVLTLYPQSILSAGFQLSFAAVIGLVGVYEMHRAGAALLNSAPHNRIKKFASYSKGLFLTSLTAGLATSIFAAWHFNQLAPLGVFANLIGMPLVAFVIMPAGIAVFLAMPLGLADAPLHLMGWGIDQLLAIADFFAQKTSKFAYIAPLHSAIFPITSLCLIWFAFFQSRLRWAAPIIAFAAIPILGIAPMPDLIISDRGTSAAAYDQNGLQMIANRRKSFTLDRWSQTYNSALSELPRLGTCDPLACVFSASKGYQVAIIKKRAAFDAECRTADIVISKLNAPEGCTAHTQVADGPFLNQNGTLLGFWDNQTQSFSFNASVPNQKRIWRPLYRMPQ